MRFLLDTDTLIYWMKGTPEIIDRVALHGNQSLAVSGISRAELFYGAFRSQRVEKNLQAIQRLSTAITFIPLSNEAQQIFGRIKAALQKQGNLIEDMDILIAATAIAEDMTLVTNNQKHFQRISELKIENWLH